MKSEGIPKEAFREENLRLLMSYRRLRVKIMTIRQALIPNDPEGFFGFEDDRSPKIPFSDRRFA